MTFNGAGKAKKKEEEDIEIINPETLERKKLKSLAFSNNILSETHASSSVLLKPSSVVAKHYGKDIIKKSQRKSSRYLFSFPGLIAPLAGDKIGDLKDLGTKNPVLYLDFPQVGFWSGIWVFEFGVLWGWLGFEFQELGWEIWNFLFIYCNLGLV